VAYRGMKSWEGLENGDLTNKNRDFMGFVAQF
jgi:hypothetical protein